MSFFIFRLSLCCAAFKVGGHAERHAYPHVMANGMLRKVFSQSIPFRADAKVGPAHAPLVGTDSAWVVLRWSVDSVADSVAVVLTRDCSNTESQNAV